MEQDSKRKIEKKLKTYVLVLCWVGYEIHLGLADNG